MRGRITAPEGLVLGHEITGELVERGPDVETTDAGGIASTHGARDGARPV
ncbi:hypothetical protein [Streptomyces viridochromogenes]